jgi:protein TonB
MPSALKFAATLALVCGAPLAQAATTPVPQAQTVQDQATDSKPVVAAPAAPVAAPVLPPDMRPAPAEPGTTRSLPVGDTHDCVSFYPPESLHASEAGSVVVGYDVGADGAIGNVHLVKTSGFDRLDQAALTCARQAWRNTPAMKGNDPVASPGHLSIVTFEVH